MLFTDVAQGYYNYYYYYSAFSPSGPLVVISFRADDIVEIGRGFDDVV